VISLCEKCDQKAVHNVGHNMLRIGLPAKEAPGLGTTASPSTLDCSAGHNHPEVVADSEVQVSVADSGVQVSFQADFNPVCNIFDCAPHPDSNCSGFDITRCFNAKGEQMLLADTGIDFELLCAMLKYENDVRLSEEIQSAYRSLGESDWELGLEVTCNLQKHVARKFGFEEAFGVMLLRCAESLVSDNPLRVAQIQEISLYRKFNRCVNGNLEEGDTAPILTHPLHKLDTNIQVNISDLTAAAGFKPLVMLVGSYS